MNNMFKFIKKIKQKIIKILEKSRKNTIELSEYEVSLIQNKYIIEQNLSPKLLFF